MNLCCHVLDKTLVNSSLRVGATHVWSARLAAATEEWMLSGRGRGLAAICRPLLETGSFVFQNARLFMFANVNICKSRCWAGADWGPPGGLEEALFTCSEECCPAPTLLYLSGTQGHCAGRDGLLCPPPKFPPHSINNKTQCGRPERRKWNSCSCCYDVQKLRFSAPFYLCWDRVTDGMSNVVWIGKL